MKNKKKIPPLRRVKYPVSFKVTPCGMVTSNGGHFHAEAGSLHLLAAKVLLKGYVFQMYCK